MHAVRGTHLFAAAAQAENYRRRATGAERWQGPRHSKRMLTRRALFRMRSHHGGVTHNPHEERLHLARRLLNSDTVTGRETNLAELGHLIPPDRQDTTVPGYSIPVLMEAQGALPHAPFDWPVWKV
jgi:hypothetical protein